MLTCSDGVDPFISTDGEKLYQCSYATNRCVDRLLALGIGTNGLGRQGSVMSAHHPETFFSETFRRHC